VGTEGGNIEDDDCTDLEVVAAAEAKRELPVGARRLE